VKRQVGAIPPIKAERYPKRIIIFDTEAYRSNPVNGVELQTLRLGVALYLELDAWGEVLKQEYYNFTTGLELTDFITWHTRKDKSLYVYAHNLRYDLQLSGLYGELVSQGWIASLFVIESPPTFIKLKQGRKSITLVDTFNYWQFSVKAMGEQLGLGKLTMPEESSPIAEWFSYCKRDVDVLSGYLVRFIKFLMDNDLAGLGLTLASQAFRSYRYRFMRQEIILHNDVKATSLERDSYFGGRCEAYHIGNPNREVYYKLDVNSMYPYVMKKELYPLQLVSVTNLVYPPLIIELLNKYYCIADVILNTTTPLYPYSNGTKLLFPIGTFRACLHHAELVKALELGDIRVVNRIAIYNQGAIFKDYVDYFYSIKLQAESEGDKITRHQAKIFLNSLYGKFGQRQIISKIVPLADGEDYKRLTGFSASLGVNVEVNYLGNAIELRYKAGESYYSFPAIAGAVTAYARVYLWELMYKAGLANVYYVDTDSLIVNQSGYDNLSSCLNNSRLGGLKLEGIENYLYIHSVKDYIFGNEVKVKGVPKSAVKLSDNSWEYEQFRGAKTWINDGMQAGFKVYTRMKERKHVYDKGILQVDGSVLPLRF
jgi:hypothetical protein